MSLIRTVFLGTPDIAAYCLGSMIKDEHFKVVGVVTQPDRQSGRKLKLQSSPVKELALSHQLPVLTPEKVNEEEVLETISSWKAEVAVVVAFGQILPQVFLDLYPRSVVNVHTSLLPRWRGAAPIQRAVMAGDQKTGVCLQVMVKKLDAGDVVGRRVIDIDDDWNAFDLHEKMKPLAADLLHVELMDYLRGNLVPLKQEESLVTYAKKIEKSETQIDWRLPAVEIHNKIRGLALGPGAHTVRSGKKLKLIKSRVIPKSKNDLPGKVIEIEADSFVVSSGDGALQILMVQPESRAEMTAKDYLRGYPFSLGEKLGESS